MSVENTVRLVRPRSSTTSGSIILMILLLLLPSILLFIKSLSIRAKLGEWMTEQQKLDHCLVSILEPRCHDLTKLSSWNLNLKQLQALSSVVAAASVLQPQLLSVLHKLNHISKFISLLQDQILIRDSLRIPLLPLKIGACTGLHSYVQNAIAKRTDFSLKPLMTLMQRSSIPGPTGTIPPLVWTTQRSGQMTAPPSERLRLTKNKANGRVESFGRCLAKTSSPGPFKSPSSAGVHSLSGETYEMYFY